MLLLMATKRVKAYHLHETEEKKLLEMVNNKKITNEKQTKSFIIGIWMKMISPNYRKRD